MKRLTVLLLLSGCASTTTPADLKAARTAYDVTTTSAVIEPLSLVAARDALDKAEASFKRHGDTPETRTLAYVAERKAEIARSTAHTLAAERVVKAENKDIAFVDRDPLRAGARAPVSTTEALVYTAGALHRERAAMESELEHQAEIIDRLHSVARIKERPGGFDAQMPAVRLFEGATTELKEPESPELDAIAFAIVRTAPHSSVVVESHADGLRGGDAADARLAQTRADAVADYLAERGVDRKNIRAVGLAPKHWDPDAAGLHGDERSIEIQVTAR